MPVYQHFPFDRIPKGSKIIIYGAGAVAKNFVAQIKALSYCEVLFIVAQNWGKVKSINDVPVYEPQRLQNCEIRHDAVVVAAKAKFHESIRKDLHELGVPEDKTVFSQNVCSFTDEEPYPASVTPWGRLSYSYHAEDLCVLFTFKALGIDKPSYIDIGANHPYTASNTALMYLHGSRGINIDANPNLIGAFFKERPSDINLNIGVAPKSGILPFYVIGNNSGESTFSFEQAELLLKKNPKQEITSILDIPVMAVDQIIEKYANGVYPDFMTIDVEGLDYEVLESCNFSEKTPYIICVEAGKLNGTLENMNAMMGKKGYELFIVLADDAIYLKKGLKEKLKIVP